MLLFIQHATRHTDESILKHKYEARDPLKQGNALKAKASGKQVK